MLIKCVYSHTGENDFVGKMTDTPVPTNVVESVVAPVAKKTSSWNYTAIIVSTLLLLTLAGGVGFLVTKHINRQVKNQLRRADDGWLDYRETASSLRKSTKRDAAPPARNDAIDEDEVDPNFTPLSMCV